MCSIIPIWAWLQRLLHGCEALLALMLLQYVLDACQGEVYSTICGWTREANREGGNERLRSAHTHDDVMVAV